MTAATAYQYINSTGVIVPDTADILIGTENEYKSVIGNDLIVTPDTPQGVLITAETLARTAVANNNAAIANQINPNESGGVFLDALLALTGMERDKITQTIVPGVTVTGVAGTVLSQGTIAKTAAGDQFATQSAVTIGAGGTATVNFASVQTGVIPCAAGALNMLVSGVLGWETVNNTAAGELGAGEQPDFNARALRSNTLAFQGVSLPIAITSALYAAAGVTSLSFLENYTNATATISGISLVANSIYACVQGGTDNDVAAALLENKSSGCNWNGGTTVNLVEPASGQTYPVKFDRPSQIGILIKITTTNGNAANIMQAVLDYASGTIDGLAGFVVGAAVSPFEIAGAIMSEYPGYYISNVQVSLTGTPAYQSTPIAIALNQIAVTQASYISVVIGP